MNEPTDEQRSIIREIILGYFELFENKSFTRKHVYSVVLADRDMPDISDKNEALTQEFDKLIVEAKIQTYGGDAGAEIFKLKKRFGQR